MYLTLITVAMLNSCPTLYNVNVNVDKIDRTFFFNIPLTSSMNMDEDNGALVMSNIINYNIEACSFLRYIPTL